MRAHMVKKYEFRVRTRDGMIVDGLSIHSQDEEGAKRKLCQMYRDCEILESRSVEANVAGRGNRLVSYEDVMEMIITGHSAGGTNMGR